MPTPYVSPTKKVGSLIIHTGNFNINQVDGDNTPQEVGALTDSQYYYSNTFTVTNQNPQPFTHFDAGVLQAANYDEIIIDILPVVKYEPKTGRANVSLTGASQDFAQVAATNRPFWILIHLTGYDVSQLHATSVAAVNTAIDVMTSMYAYLKNSLLVSNFQGFAFLRPNLNIVYDDRSPITRKQQNLLVQTCWSTFNCACCFVTSRPYDIMTLVAPTLTYNTNSETLLDHPIIGCNPAYKDKLVITYPSIRPANQNISIIMGQSINLFIANNRDPGFQLNLTYAYVLPTDDFFWIPDGVGGVNPSTNAVEENIKNIFNFAAAFGYNQMGMYGDYSTAQVLTGRNVPAPTVFLPNSSAVNTTGSFIAWADAGNVFVAYSDGNGGNKVRQFSSTFVETPYTGTYT